MDKPSMEEMFRIWGAIPVFVARDWRTISSAEDYTQEARLAMIEAREIVDWDIIEHNGQFAKFVKRHANNRIGELVAHSSYATSGSKSSMNRHKGLHYSVSLNAAEHVEVNSAYDTEWASDTDWELLESVYPAIEEALTEREREVIGLYYLDALLNDADVASVLEVTSQAVNKTRRRAEEKIRVFLAQG